MSQLKDYRELSNRRSRLKKILAWVLGGAFALFVLFMALGFIISTFMEDEVATSPAQPEASPRAVPPTTIPSVEPTATAEPMPTTVPTALPTATPRPTPTVTPTPTTVEAPSCDSPAAQAYLTEQGPIAEGIAQSLGNIGILFTAVGLSPTLLVDLDWQLQTAAELVTINSLSDDALRLSTPDPLKPMDEDFKASARKLKEFVDLAITGIDDFDTNALLQAQDAMVEAGILASSAGAKLEEICG